MLKDKSVTSLKGTKIMFHVIHFDVLRFRKRVRSNMVSSGNTVVAHFPVSFKHSDPAMLGKIQPYLNRKCREFQTAHKCGEVVFKPIKKLKL